MHDKLVTVICYGCSRIWKSRSEAIRFYGKGMLECEGAESERYKCIVGRLLAGDNPATDDLDNNIQEKEEMRKALKKLKLYTDNEIAEILK